ncbi:MAG: SulP family inorganic anion transporter [Puniceicoccaceae bacterium]
MKQPRSSSRPPLVGDLFHRFRTNSLRSDLLGGATTAVISLPLALAFGVASGAGAAAGIYGAVIVGLFAAIFGGTRTLISEPTGPMTVIMTAVVTSMIAQDPEHGLSAAFAVVIVAGLTQILFGVLRLGKYITLMPYSVISGFMSGIGILLILMQLAPLLGQAPPPGGSIGVLTELPRILSGILWQEALLSGIALLCLFAVPKKVRRTVPPHLIALLLGTLVAVLFFADSDLRRIGEIPMGLPSFNFPSFSLLQLSTIMVDGIILGVLGCIDTLLTAMIADSLTRDQHDSDRELFGQGIANTVAGFFGGLPGAGATMGTVVNIQIGARSPIAAVVRSIILLSVLLAIAPYLANVPLAVLAAIAFKVGLDILDWSFLKRAHRVSLTATSIMYGVMAITVLVDLLVAVGLGVFIANILTIEKLSRFQSSGIRAMDTSDAELPLSDEEKTLFQKANGKVVLLHLSGPMIFGVAKAISREQSAVKNARVLILDLTEVPFLSTTVLLALENVILDALNRRLPVFVATSGGETKGRLERLELTDAAGAVFVETRLQALQQALVALEDKSAIPCP